MIELKPTTTTDEYTVGLVIGDQHGRYEAMTANNDVLALSKDAMGPLWMRYAAIMRNGEPIVILDDEAVRCGPHVLADVMAERAAQCEAEARRWSTLASKVLSCKEWPEPAMYTRRCLELDAKSFCDFKDVVNAAIDAHVATLTTDQLERLVSSSRAQPMDDIPF